MGEPQHVQSAKKRIKRLPFLNKSNTFVQTEAIASGTD
jgi:hypothetical protein